MGWNNHIRKVDNEEYFRKHKELLIYYYKWASSWFCIKERHLKSFVLCNESDETNIDQRKQYRYLYQRAMDSKDFDSFMKLAV